MAKLLKENETLKRHYKEMSNSIKKTRAKTIKHITSLIAENAEFKAQLQEKGFAIAALKNELRKLTGNSVNTKFAKSSILGKPVLQPHRNQSVVKQLTAFKSKQPRISKPRFASQIDVNNDLPKPITTHYLPKGKESACAKPHHMITPGSSSSELGIHNHNNEPSSSKLVPKVVPSADTSAPSKQELDLLFGPLYDEFFTAGTSCVNKSSSPTDNSTQQDTPPSATAQSTTELITPSTTITAEDNIKIVTRTASATAKPCQGDSLNLPDHRKNHENPYLIYDIYSGAHEDDECDQVESREQACLSSGNIYDDPSLLKFYQNNDIPLWGNLIRIREEEEGPDWVVRSKLEDEMANFMMEKKYHLKRLREMLHQQRNDMYKKFSQILSTLDDKTTNKEPTLAIITRSRTTMRDPSYPNQPNSTPIVTNETAAEEGKIKECSTAIQKNLPQRKEDPGSFTLPCLIETMLVKNALADLRASINLMPHSLFLKLGILELKPTKISIQLVDRSIKYPIVIDVHDKKLSLRVGEERVTFNIGKSMKYALSQDNYMYFVDHTDEMVQEQSDDTLDPDRN
ncbi:hypothetical protein Tco_1314892 [Tanacetum coccineum]